MSDNKNSQSGCIWITAFILLLVFSQGYFYIKKNYLLPMYGKVTFGKVIDATNTGKSTKSIIYEYKTLNGQIYNGSTTAPSGFLGCWKKRDCIGKYYKVKYLENYPTISEMYLYQEVSDTLNVN